MTQLMQPSEIDSFEDSTLENPDKIQPVPNSGDRNIYPKLKSNGVFNEVDQENAQKVYENYLELSTGFCEAFASALETEHLVSLHLWLFGCSLVQDMNSNVIIPNNQELHSVEDKVISRFAYRRITSIVDTLNQFLAEKIGDKFSLDLPPMDKSGEHLYLPLLSVSFSKQGSLEIVQALSAIEAHLVPRMAKARKEELNIQQRIVEARKSSKWWKLKQLALALPDPVVNMSQVDEIASLSTAYIAKAMIRDIKQSGVFTTKKPTQEELKVMSIAVIDCLEVLMDDEDYSG